MKKLHRNHSSASRGGNQTAHRRAELIDL